MHVCRCDSRAAELGGLVAVGDDGRVRYEWRDGGICHTANFEELLAAL